MQKICRIINNLDSPVNIRDLKVVLKNSGSYAEVPYSEYIRSRDIVPFKSSLTVQFINQEKPMPFWPFICDNSSFEDEPENTDSFIAPPPPDDEDSPFDENDSYVDEVRALRKEVSDVKNSLFRIEDLMVRDSERFYKLFEFMIASNKSIQPSIQPSIPSHRPSSRSIDDLMGDEHFIPSSIMPSNAEIKINTIKDSDTMSSSSFNEGMDALRKMKKK
jgi:hypothetical protein